MTAFSNEYKHEIPYENDCHSASGFYTDYNCIYQLTELLKSMAEERTRTPPCTAAAEFKAFE